MTNSRLSRVVAVKWAAAIILPALFWLIPVGDVFTLPMRSFLVATVFVLSLAAFELLPNLLVGLLLPLAYVMLGAVETSVALSIWSSSFMIFMIIGGMIFANALDESGLLNRLVLWAGTKCKGSLAKILLALFVAGFLVMSVSFSNGWMATLVLCYGVVKALHLEHTKEGILIMIVGQIVSTTALNFIYSPVTVSLWSTGVQMADPDFQLQWWSLPLYNLPLILINLLMIPIFIKLYKPTKVLKGGQEYFEQEYARLGPISGREKKAIILTILLFAYIFLQPIHKLDINWGFILIPILFFLPGVDVATKEKSLDTVNVGFIVFIASCMGIGAVGGAVGIGQAISVYVTPLLSGVPKPVFLFLCIIFGIIMNILMTPSAMQGMFPGPLAALGTGLGIAYPALPFMAMFFANDMVFFPYENAYLLVLFGFGVMSMKDFMKYNVIKMGITLVLFWILVLPYWYILGLV
ncbi:MAG: hypothetical protein Q4C56_05885 [Peptococcaceae bacterium]|nr:hypothetical protein [Peptococcaceae bacterium]